MLYTMRGKGRGGQVIVSGEGLRGGGGGGGGGGGPDPCSLSYMKNDVMHTLIYACYNYRPQACTSF